MDRQNPTGPLTASTVKNPSQRDLCPERFTAGISAGPPSALVMVVISDTSALSFSAIVEGATFAAKSLLPGFLGPKKQPWTTCCRFVPMTSGSAGPTIR